MHALVERACIAIACRAGSCAVLPATMRLLLARFCSCSTNILVRREVHNDFTLHVSRRHRRQYHESDSHCVAGAQQALTGNVISSTCLYVCSILRTYFTPFVPFYVLISPLISPLDYRMTYGIPPSQKAKIRPHTGPHSRSDHNSTRVRGLP